MYSTINYSKQKKIRGGDNILHSLNLNCKEISMSDSLPTLHPRPPVQQLTCPKCSNATLGSLRCCVAGGHVLENYGRWFQVVRRLLSVVGFKKFTMVISAPLKIARLSSGITIRRHWIASPRMCRQALSSAIQCLRIPTPHSAFARSLTAATLTTNPARQTKPARRIRRGALSAAVLPVAAGLKSTISRYVYPIFYG